MIYIYNKIIDNDKRYEKKQEKNLRQNTEKDKLNISKKKFEKKRQIQLNTGS